MAAASPEAEAPQCGLPEVRVVVVAPPAGPEAPAPQLEEGGKGQYPYRKRPPPRSTLPGATTRGARARRWLADFVTSPHFQCAAQLVAGTFVSALFVLVK